jgi:hypothetical protein
MFLLWDCIWIIIEVLRYPRSLCSTLLSVSLALFAWLISHQPAVLFSQNKPATSNQPAVLFSQNKLAPAISHQPNEHEQAIWLARRARNPSPTPSVSCTKTQGPPPACPYSPSRHCCCPPPDRAEVKRRERRRGGASEMARRLAIGKRSTPYFSSSSAGRPAGGSLGEGPAPRGEALGRDQLWRGRNSGGPARGRGRWGDGRLRRRGARQILGEGPLPA